MAFPLRLHWAMAALLGFAGLAHAEPRPAVIELFTSEGCNSCPPAEAYVGELAGRSDVLALSFHVDYWDDLGWRDRYGLSQSVERQRTYARSLRLSGVYTPQVVIDGRADYVGSNRSAIDRALKLNRDGVPVSLSVIDGEARVRLDPPAGLGGSRGDALQNGRAEKSQPAKGQPDDVVLIAYLRKAVSPIGRGENAGRTLEEFNIVRAVQPLGQWDGSTQEFRTKLASLPQDTTDVAVLVQSPGQGGILGAATQRVR
jgi:hypothetical protein